MKKEEVFQFLLEHSKPYCKEEYFKKKFPEFYNDLMSFTFPNDFNFQQKLYHYFNDDLELKLGHCVMCGKRCGFKCFVKGYRTTCSAVCAHNNPITKEKVKNTNLKKFGVENPFQSEDKKEKIKDTLMKKYGCDHPMHCKEIICKLQKTNLERYGNVCSLHGKDVSEIVRKNNLEKYGIENAGGSKIAQQKILESKRKNHTFNTSKVEILFEKYLIDNNIEYMSQYKSDKRYPFACDFYFPKYDLFFEINGIWTHGKHPYDKNNIDDIKLVEKWKSKNTQYYDNAIKIYTERDVMKRNIAKLNGLNYVEVFSKDINDVINSFINTISKLNYKI